MHQQRVGEFAQPRLEQVRHRVHTHVLNKQTNSNQGNMAWLSGTQTLPCAPPPQRRVYTGPAVCARGQRKRAAQEGSARGQRQEGSAKRAAQEGSVGMNG